MKKLVMAAALFVAGVSFANAEGYNRVALSFDHGSYSYNDNAKPSKDCDGIGTNGFGINYIHGFGVAENMFVETGLNFNMGWGSSELWSDVDGSYTEKTLMKMQNMNLQLPVNFVYRIGVGENMWVSPYVGLNFKLNLVTKTKDKMELGGDVDADDQKYVDEWNNKQEWVNVYSDSEKDMGHKDNTWNRFQMGWHIGCGFQYSKYYVGIQWGTDFIPAYSHKFDDGKYKVNSSNLKVSLGYTF